MAKKKEETESGNSVLEKYGDIIKSGRSVLDRKRKVISISPALDIATGGGVLEGDLVIFTGKPKIGKSSTALALAANAQKDGRQVYYFDIEGRLKERDLTGVPDLQIDKLNVVESSMGNILTAEKFLEIGEVILKTIPNVVVIMDSFSALCSEKEMTSDIDKHIMGETQKLTAKFCRKVAGALPVNRSILVGITHIAPNISGYGAAWIEGGGMKLGYAVNSKFWAKTMKPWKLNEQGEQIGQEIEWDIVTSSISGTGKRAKSYLRYGESLDRWMEIANIAEEIGIIEKGGAWYTLASLPDKPKIQGMEKVRQALKDNEEWYNQIRTEVYQLMGVKEE